MRRCRRCGVRGVFFLRCATKALRDDFGLPKVGLIARTGYADKRAPTLANTSYFSSDRN